MGGWAMVDSPVFALYAETYRRWMYSTNISSALQTETEVSTILTKDIFLRVITRLYIQDLCFQSHAGTHKETELPGAKCRENA